MLDPKTSALSKTLRNADTFTQNLNANNHHINAIIEQLNATTKQISEVNIKETVSHLNHTLAAIQTLLEKAKGKEGTVGLLLNDPRLYENLQQTSRSLTILLDDLKTHPKRYVSFSVFGKKEKLPPLKKPLSDTIQPQQR